MDITNLKIAKNWYCKVVEKGLNWVRVQARGRACARFAKKKSHPGLDAIFWYASDVSDELYYSAASVAVASAAGASALGAAFLPARRVVFLAAALGVLSIFSL